MTTKPPWDEFSDGTSARISARRWVSFRVKLVEADRERGPVLQEQWDQRPEDRWERSGMFESFLRLAEQSDHAIERFANRYGVLGLCKHGVPMRALADIRQAAAGPLHRSVPDAAAGNVPPVEAERSRRPATSSCAPMHVGPSQAERIEHWRAWSHRLGAAIAVGQQVAAGLQPEETLVEQMVSGRVATGTAADGHWSGLDEHVDTTSMVAWLTGRINGVTGVRLQRTQAWYFCRFVNHWLGVQALLEPVSESDQRLHLQYGPTGLFPALALNAALAVAGLASFVVCSNCGRPYLATRRPVPGRRSYCSRHQCRLLAAQRDAARDYRARRS